jgi:hypothetical protein
MCPKSKSGKADIKYKNITAKRKDVKRIENY